MTTFRSLACCAVLVAMMTSCAKKTPVPAEKKDYIGSWVGESGSTMTIYADGGCDFEQKKSNSSSSMQGAAVNWEGNKLICKMGITSEFAIDQAPKLVDGKWQMKLDGETYTKK